MATLNKRHQARNERALQNLVQDVPGNSCCADCQARNPGWASWSLGIFLCMRCGSLHRKLGTHISKVKSLSMDSWSSDQVENMRQIGNIASNQKYNPTNTKPPIPLDVDEVDAAMERFIRQKYEQKAYVAGAPARTAVLRPEPPYPQDIEQLQGDGDHPPPPQKQGRRFGLSFRSASAALPGRSKSKVKPEPVRKSSATASGKVFGAAFGVTDEGLEWKLVTLREMGFPDEKRNSSVLKGVNGDLERAIESLVRLGERSGAVREDSMPPSDILTGSSTATGPSAAKPVTGIESQPSNQESPWNKTSMVHPPQEDFWNAISPVPVPLHASPTLENAVHDMHLGNVQLPLPQPLFPNATGGHIRHVQAPMIPNQQSMTPPVPQMPQQFANNPYTQSSSHNPFVTSPVQQYSGPAGNPFLASQPVTGYASTFAATSPGTGAHYSHNQYHQPQVGPQQTSAQSWANQPHLPTAHNGEQLYLNLQQSQQSTATQTIYNPFLQQQQQQQLYPQQTQPVVPHPSGRIDKYSIMALYNYPQLAPQPPAPPLHETQGVSASDAEQTHYATQLPPENTTVQRSATMPASGSKNPFAPSAASPNAAAFGGTDESGRHSPDAFASLSARFVR